MLHLLQRITHVKSTWERWPEHLLFGVAYFYGTKSVKYRKRLLEELGKSGKIVEREIVRRATVPWCSNVGVFLTHLYLPLE